MGKNTKDRYSLYKRMGMTFRSVRQLTQIDNIIRGRSPSSWKDSPSIGHHEHCLAVHELRWKAARKRKNPGL